MEELRGVLVVGLPGAETHRRADVNAALAGPTKARVGSGASVWPKG